MNKTIQEHRIERPRFPIISEDSIFRYCVIDSRNRNKVAYPNPNNYSYELNDVFRDIVYIEIQSSCIEANYYNITSANNSITITIDGVVYILNITPGYYPLRSTSDSSYQSVGEIVTTELGYLGGIIGLRYNANQNVFYFYETGTPAITPYSLTPSPLLNSLGFTSNTDNSITGTIVVSSLGSGNYRVIINGTSDTIIRIQRGFYMNDNDFYIQVIYGASNILIRKTTISEFIYTATSIEFVTSVAMTTTGTVAMTGAISMVVGNTTANLNTPCYLLLDIPELQRLEGNQTAINKSFFQIPIGTHYRTYDNTNSYISLYFNPPLPKLDRIRVKFFDTNGNPYDFGSRNEHVFTLGIRELNTNRQVH